MKEMTVETIEEQVHRALALEVISNVFPFADDKSMQGLDKDADLLTEKLRVLPDNAGLPAVQDVIEHVKLRLSYRDSLARTLCQLLAFSQESQHVLASA